MFEKLLRRRRRTVRLQLYTRPECPLCDELKAELVRLGARRPAWELVLEERDVESDPVLEERHGLSVPVLELGGRALAKGRASVTELEDRLARRLADGEERS